MEGTLAQQAVDTANRNFGSHPGFRALHAKGVLAKGTFTATPAARALTRAAHMQGDPCAALVRFSNGAGNPRLPDYARDVRGMAVKFQLPGGEETDIVCVDSPCFATRTPEDFVKLLRASKPVIGELPGPGAALFLATHPESWKAARHALTAKPLASYGAHRYNGLHAFKWLDAEGGERYVRYSWLPEAGELFISGKEAKERGRDYLGEELAERLGQGPIRFMLQLQIAGDGDPIEDPTAMWPAERETVDAGTLELTELETGREQGDDLLVFDPVRVIDGIELSGDPILTFRSEAYSVSIDRRIASRP